MINWKTLSEDDYIAIQGDYTLRVEEMDVGYWWWNVSYKDQEIKFGNALHGESAKVKSEMFMNRHLKLNK